MSERFVRAVEATLAHEGGYVHDPRDPGGETKYGISKRSYPNEDIANLTRARAVELYRRDFWDRHGYGRLRDEGLALKAFDLAVNAGPLRANRWLQRAYNRLCVSDHRGLDLLREDGALGPKTLEAVNGYRHPRALVMALKLEAGVHYSGLDKPEFLAGWLTRLDT